MGGIWEEQWQNCAPARDGVPQLAEAGLDKVAVVFSVGELRDVEHEPACLGAVALREGACGLWPFRGQAGCALPRGDWWVSAPWGNT